MPKSDKPVVNLTFAKLDAEETPEPFVYVTKENHRIVFPDIYDMEAEEGQEFLDDVSRMTNNYEPFERWLDPEDYKALRADKLKLRQLLRLSQAVMGYYEGSLGTPGEEKSSGS